MSRLARCLGAPAALLAGYVRCDVRRPSASPKTKTIFWGGNFGGGFGGSTKYSPKKLTFRGNIYHFRVFYLESASPEPKESSIIMKIGFKFAKIEHFQNLQEIIKNGFLVFFLPLKYYSLKRPADFMHICRMAKLDGESVLTSFIVQARAPAAPAAGLSGIAL